MNNIKYIIYYLLFLFGIHLSYKYLDILFKKIKSYDDIYPKHKQIYFVSNFIKSLLLGIFSINGVYILKDYFLYDKWNQEDIKYLGAMYSSLDLVSMFNVEKMQINTKIHHGLVQILYLYPLIFLDFSKDTVSNGVVIYAIFSTFSFIVNFYLAIRLTLKDVKLLKIIASISYIVYQFCCCLNWSYQLYFIYTSSINIFIKFLYSTILSLIIFDDIVLIKFLNKNSYLN
jgi:hypothetical protein